MTNPAPSRHALVTGANRGIGLEFVRQLLVRGDRVVATCRHPGKAAALNTLTGDYPGRLHVLPLDVADPKSRAELVRELSLLGGDQSEPPQIGLLINNAGVLHSGERFGELLQTTLEDTLRINVCGPLLFTQTLAPWLGDGSSIVNISSNLGSISAVRGFGHPSYCISKAALNMVTAQLAHALRDRRINVVALHPGWVQTDMGGDGAQIAAQDSVAGMLRTIDGATIDASGGFFDWQGERVAW